jgi:hypothetical protein
MLALLSSGCIDNSGKTVYQDTKTSHTLTLYSDRTFEEKDDSGTFAGIYRISDTNSRPLQIQICPGLAKCDGRFSCHHHTVDDMLWSCECSDQAIHARYGATYRISFGLYCIFRYQ